MTGSARNAASPAITMNAETTDAKIGRSMKKREITALGSTAGVAGASLGGTGAGLCGDSRP